MIRGKLDLTPGQWAQVRQIYDEALDAPEGRRVEAALRLCDGDGQLESALGQLFAATGSGSFLDEPASKWLLPPVVRLFADGTILCGRFRILRFISSGGMGDVYEAWDPNVREVVALKTIRPELSAFPAVIERFQEEVRHAHQINHPHVCRVHDLYVHQDDPYPPIWFLTMQYLEGPTLREYLAEHGPLSPAAALQLIEQMIAGLTAAHDLGVVHRDFKPGNVMLVNGAKDAAKNRANGGAGGKTRAVITDFGLAAKTAVAGEERDGETFRGVGTPAYVAPEQWYKGVVSPASDQYSLGVVICEMVAGERPSCGSPKERADSPIELPKGHKLNARWQAVIRRCTAPRPQDRFQSLAEILPALDPRRRKRGILLRLAQVLILPAAAVLAMFLYLRWSRPPRIVNLKRLTPALSLSVKPSLSKDAKMIAYASDRSQAGNLDIYVQRLPDGAPLRITADPSPDDDPSISPDGKTVLFRSERNGGGIYIAETTGSGERLLVSGGQNPRFSPDGLSFLYWKRDDSKLIASGLAYIWDFREGTSSPIAADFADARTPVWHSDGLHILFEGCPQQSGPVPSCSDWWVTDIMNTTPRKTGAVDLLARSGISHMREVGGWRGDDLVFSGTRGSETRLWRLKLSVRDARATEAPTLVIPEDSREDVPSSSMSSDGHLAFTQLSSSVQLWRIEDPSHPVRGLVRKLTNDTDLVISPSVSPDGRWLIFARGWGENRSLWIRDLESDTESMFPAGHPDKFAPLVDDTGTAVIYNSWENGVPSIYLSKRGEGESLVCSECRNPTSWFDGSRGVLYSNSSLSDIALYSFATRSSRVILHSDRARFAEAAWSPKNQFLAFTVSFPQTRNQIYVARFSRQASSPERRWIPISEDTTLADKPRWSGDGKKLYYFSRRDGFGCLWGRKFDPVRGEPVGKPYVIHHYHDVKSSPFSVSARSLNLSSAGDSLYLNVAELTGTVWVGQTAR